MLVPSSSTPAAPRNGFVIEVVEGDVRSQLYAGSNAQTLAKYTRALSAVAREVITSSLPGAAHTNPPVADTMPAAVVSQPATPATLTERAPATDDGVLATVVDARPGDPSKHSDAVVWLSEAIKFWLAHGTIDFSPTTWKYSYEPSFRMARELLGSQRRDFESADGSVVVNQLDIPIRQIDRRCIEDLADGMRKMPARQGKRNDGLEAPQLVAQTAANKLPLRSAGNVAQRLRHLDPFIQFAAKKGWIPAVAAGEFSEQLKKAESRAGKAAANSAIHKPGAVSLTRDDLKATYESPLYLEGAIKRDWMHWSDPVRLYTGARVSEFSQLFTDDIVLVDGIPCFSFVNDPPPPGQTDAETGGVLTKAATFEEDRRLKNQASRRIIPIAPALIDMGFMDFVRERQEFVGRHPGLLFVGLKWQPKSGYGRRPSEHTLDLLKAAEVWQRRRKVGHSLRASCTQELERVGMNGELLDRYLGHSTRTQRGRSYNERDVGPAYPVQIALEFLRKMDFGVQFPTYAEIKQKRADWARHKQLARKNSDARRNQTPEPAPKAASSNSRTSTVMEA